MLTQVIKGNVFVPSIPVSLTFMSCCSCRVIHSPAEQGYILYSGSTQLMHQLPKFVFLGVVRLTLFSFCLVIDYKYKNGNY